MECNWLKTKFALMRIALYVAITAPTVEQRWIRRNPMSYKRKYKQGGKILSLDALTKQDFVYWHDKIMPRKWFMCWQIEMTIRAVEAGIIRYAIPNMNTNELPKEETNDKKQPEEAPGE